MQNLENLDVFEILITQNLLKCLKDPFVRSALIYIYKIYVGIAIFHILLICNRVIALDGCQNFVSAQYL